MPYMPTSEEWDILERHHIGTVGPVVFGGLDRKMPIGTFKIREIEIKIESWADLEQVLVDVKMGAYDAEEEA